MISKSELSFVGRGKGEKRSVIFTLVGSCLFIFSTHLLMLSSSSSSRQGILDKSFGASPCVIVVAVEIYCVPKATVVSESLILCSELFVKAR
ncbi:hypothetical protein D3C78_812710 [compost metagenome]